MAKQIKITATLSKMSIGEVDGCSCDKAYEAVKDAVEAALDAEFGYFTDDDRITVKFAPPECDPQHHDISVHVTPDDIDQSDYDLDDESGLNAYVSAQAEADGEARCVEDNICTKAREVMQEAERKAIEEAA